MLPALALLASALVTQTPPPASLQVEEKLPFVTTLHVENDVLAQSDRYYTNGTRVAHYGEYDGCRRFARTLGFTDTLDHRYLCGGALAQNIYTPVRITPEPGEEPWPDPNDRPYGGWLHGAFLFQRLVAAAEATDSSRLTLQVSVGVTGPASGAEWTQRGFHSLLRRIQGGKSPRDPIGWDAQLPTEPALLVSALYERPLFWSPYVDATGAGGAMLGTVFTNASVGGTVRVGWLARPFGLSPIMASVMMARMRAEGASEDQALAARREVEARERTWEAYLFARGQARLVARNLFLDGTFFRRSPSVRKKPFVGDADFGAAARLRHFQLELSMVFRSQEVADPPDIQRAGHRFVQLQLSYLH